MSIFLIISLACSFILGIAFIIYYFSNIKEINTFMGYGIVISITFIIVNLFASNVGGSLIMSAITYVKVAIYTCIGMHLCSSLGIKGLPLIRRIINRDSYDKINIKSYTLAIMTSIIGAVLFSYVLFKVTNPTASEMLKNIIESDGSLTQGGGVNFGLIFMMISVGISEEISFRFVTQNYLAKKFTFIRDRYWIAIVISALLWTFAHANTTNPEWVKFVQIFPVGLTLGWMFKKFGLESCIIAHAGFNVIMTLIPVL